MSTIVQVDAINAEDAGRVSTLLDASAAGRGTTGQLRIQTIYDEARATMKVVVIGGLAESAETLRRIGVMVEPG